MIDTRIHSKGLRKRRWRKTLRELWERLTKPHRGLSGHSAFWSGVASINLMPPRLQKGDYSPEAARRKDYEALKGDWKKIGEDMRRVMGDDRKSNGY